LFPQDVPNGTTPLSHMFWEGGVGGEIFLFLICFHYIPINFPRGSPSVPQDIPICTSNLSHIVLPQFNFHIYIKCKRGIKGYIYASILGKEAYLASLFFGNAQKF
jgi:hypothetical protein